ncbi:MAG: hypothetical protein RR482_00595 [Clostridia bacterium]
MKLYHGRKPKEVLDEYRMTVLELGALHAQYAKLLFLGAPRVVGGVAVQDSASSRHTNDSEAARMQAQDGVLSKIDELEREKLVLIADFEAVLKRVQSARIRTVLRFYYALGNSEEQVAQEMGISRSSINRMRTTILEILSSGERNDTA